MLFSCSESVDFVPTSLEFLVSTDEDRTRGAMASSYLDLEDIGVFAYSASQEWGECCEMVAPDVANNLRVSRTLREWRYDEPLYWEDIEGEFTSLFAYAPYCTDSSVSVVSCQSGFVLRYVVPQLCADQPDLMVATPVCDCTADYGAVTFYMQSTLCDVGFFSPSDVVEMISVELSGVVCTAELKMYADGSFEWILESATSLEVEIAGLEESLMMIPQGFADGASMVVTYRADGGELLQKTIALTAEQWGVDGVVRYEI